MASSLGYLFIAVVAWVVLSSAFSFYSMFRAPRCPADAGKKACIVPLFTDGEPVDFYIYLTADPKIQWWTPQGLRRLEETPLWNSTAVKYGESITKERAIVPLSAERLRGVRRNESALYAHCFLVRGGKRLDENLPSGRAVIHPIDGPDAGVLSAHALHAGAELTRLLPQVFKKRRNLLGNSTVKPQRQQTKDGLDNDTADGGEDADAGGSSEEGPPPVLAELPGTGWKFSVYPDDALMWVISVFSVAAFFQPNMYTVAIRHTMLVVLMPWLVQLRMQQKDMQAAMQRERAQEEQRAFWWQANRPPVPHIVPFVHVAMSVDAESYDAKYPPPLLYKEMLFDDASSPMPTSERDVRYRVVGRSPKRYVPPFAIDHFGLQQRTWRPLDSDTSKPDFEIPIEVDVTGMMRYSVFKTIQQSLTMYTRMGFTERDLEDVQDFLFRYPLRIMIIMQVISFAQMSLTALAFKNDISFFRGRSDYTGLSSRSLATDTLQEIIIFLYLYDYDDISRIVLFQIGMSSLISAWKCARVARLGVYWARFLPWVSYGRGVGENQDEKDTEEIDARGMRYLTWVLYPISLCWGMYNLYHYSYKSWWSWFISSMADFAYTFGFINMLPQIFINYRLQSVAHMPWRVLMYKFFNTFIDDVFAFFIMSDHMTQKHRFMTLRDDVVFFVFLYQRHIYKVDHSRADEYGFVYADGDPKQTDDSASSSPKPAPLPPSVERSEVQADENPGQANGSPSSPAAPGPEQPPAAPDEAATAAAHGRDGGDGCHREGRGDEAAAEAGDATTKNEDEAAASAGDATTKDEAEREEEECSGGVH